MTELLEFYWPLYRDGYELRTGKEIGRKKPTDALLGKSEGPDLWVVPAVGSHPVEPEEIAKVRDFREPLKLGLSVYRNFISYEATPEGALSFTGKYGFLHDTSHSEPQGMMVSDWLHRQQNMRAAIAKWEKDTDVWKMIFDFNAVNLGPLKTRLRANRTGNGVFVVLQPEDLWAMMWLEFALQVSNQSGIRQCEWCNSWFPYGTGTGRRSKAKFCSDPCQKASHVKSKKRGGGINDATRH